MSGRVSRLEERLEQVIERLGALERGGGPLALITELDARRGPPWERDGRRGALTYASAVEIGGRPMVWRRDHAVPDLLDADPEVLAVPLAALGHPDRLKLLRTALLAGPTRTPELEEALAGSSPGRLYHHLNELRRGGWLRQVERGVWAVPPERVGTALVALAIAREVGEDDRPETA